MVDWTGLMLTAADLLLVHRHYTYRGRHVRVCRLFKDTVIIQDVIPCVFGPTVELTREEFAQNAELITKEV